MPEISRRIHIGLSDAVKDRLKAVDPLEAVQIIEGLASKWRLRRANVERAVEYGVLSGDAPEKVFATLSEHAAKEVAWIEADEERGAL